MNLPPVLKRLDGGLLLAAFILIAFGVAAITSVELSRGEEEFLLVRKHLSALALGLMVGLGALTVNVQAYRAFARLAYLSGVVMLILVLFIGQTFHGTTGWFIFLGLSFQPVEWMKVALCLELARYLSDDARHYFGWREFLGSGLRASLPVFLLLAQPDWGGAFIMAGIWAVLVFVAGVRWFHFTTLIAAVALALGIGWLGFGQSDFVQTRLARLETFVNPSASDPLAEGYNIMQARIAIGSGGLVGRGLGGGSQSQLKFLPESQTDFIFAVIAEELGLLGVSLVFVAYLLLFWRVSVLLRSTRDIFAAYTLIALAGFIFLQTSIHIGVNLALVPTTGVTLPFVSYGGSSLLMTLLSLGIMEGVARRIPPVDRLAKT